MFLALFQIRLGHSVPMLVSFIQQNGNVVSARNGCTGTSELSQFKYQGKELLPSSEDSIAVSKVRT
jgi:hypothetical protein